MKSQVPLELWKSIRNFPNARRKIDQEVVEIGYRMMCYRALIVLVSTFVLQSSIASSAEQPPCPKDSVGNTIATAFDLGVLGAQKIVWECIDTKADQVDVYRLSLASDGFLGVGIAARAAALTASLLDSNGVRLDSASAIPGKFATLGKLLSAGTYYVQVGGASGIADYTLDLLTRIDVRKASVKSGTSIAWTSMGWVVFPIESATIQIPSPVGAGSAWVVDGVKRSIDSTSWRVTASQYPNLRYIAGTAGSSETVYFKFNNKDGSHTGWTAGVVESVP